ncbi:MAG: RidA family protein [Lysobacterales bacterium]
MKTYVRLALKTLIFLALFVGFSAAAEKPVKHPSPGDAGYPFSEAVSYGGVLYLSGEVGIRPDRTLAPGGISAEARQTMDNIKTKLARYKLGMDDIIKCTVFLANIDEWGAFNDVYKTYFPNGEFPARSALAASGLAIGARVEVECLAAIATD